MITNKILIWNTKKDAEQFKQVIKEILEEIENKIEEAYNETNLSDPVEWMQEIQQIIKQKAGEELK